jgi:adenosylcobinamide-GDP ribazoletransferase
VRVARVDRAEAGWAMTLAPVVGLALGGAAAAVFAVADRLTGSGPLLSAGLAVGTLAVLTRGLHLDGLADLADGLGSGRPADQALDIMKRSDIGPFGVVTLVLTLLVQVAAVSRAGPAALMVSCVTGRLAITWACGPGVPAARPGGLGSLVTGTVRPAAAALVTALTLAGAGLAGWPASGPGSTPGAAVRAGAGYVLAVVLGLAAAWWLRRRAVRRLGGVTGDVFGALAETATATALVVCAAAA